jgi:hypothetical protein
MRNQWGRQAVPLRRKGWLAQSAVLGPTDKNEIGQTLRRVPRIDDGRTYVLEIPRVPGNYG